MEELNSEDLPESFTSRLMQEIKVASGLSHSELASALSPYADLSDTMISHYLNGKKSMGQSRLYVLAQAARKLGWTGETIDQLCHLSKVFSDIEIGEYQEFLRKGRKLTKRGEITAVANLEQAVAAMLGEGWSDTEIVTLTALLTEKLIPEYVRESGGLVQLAALRRLAGLDDAGVAPIAWSTWQVMEVDVGDAEGVESGTPE